MMTKYLISCSLITIKQNSYFWILTKYSNNLLKNVMMLSLIKNLNIKIAKESFRKRKPKMYFTILLIIIHIILDKYQLRIHNNLEEKITFRLILYILNEFIMKHVFFILNTIF